MIIEYFIEGMQKFNLTGVFFIQKDYGTMWVNENDRVTELSSTITEEAS